MKKILMAMLGMMSICLVGCSKSSPVKDATEEYVKANGSNIMAIALLEQIGGNDVKAKVKIIEWDDTPIDTITKADFYKYELKPRIVAANQYKLGTLHRDSLEIERYQREIESAYSDFTKNLFEGLMNSAIDKLRADQRYYQKQVNQINKIKELAAQPDKDDALYYVYHFTESISFKHPVTGERVSREFKCFSYADLVQSAITYVAEGVDDYTPAYEQLHSPIRFEDDEEDIELL